jgi:Zn-dependent peptidase ImmA (M78 family)
MRSEVQIDPEIIRWAIDRAGYDLDEFFAKLPNAEKWIAREKNPTPRQLEEFSKKVHLPFGYLFLPEPPKERLPIPFFRTSGKTTNVSLNVYDTVLLLQQRQDWLRNYLKDLKFETCPFVGRSRQITDVQAIVNDIRRTLGLDEDWASHYRSWTDALTALTNAIEERGIITVFNGVVENNTSRPIEVKECRGFVLVDEYAPFMFVNNSDSKSAQMFTIVHELAHIWTGISAGFDLRRLLPAQDPIEVLCDKVAAEFLVPRQAFERVWARTPNLNSCSRYFKVSELVIARRALDTRKISKDSFFGFYDEYINRDFDKRANQQSGGDFYATTKKRLSMTFAGHVHNAVRSGKLLYRDAYRLTSLKGKTFETFYAKHF